MQTIPIALALSEMVIAKDVKRPGKPDGHPICGKGVVLTETVIERLKTMGVQSITVEGRPIKMDGEASLEEMLSKLDKRFKKVEDDDLTMNLKTIYRKQIVKSMGI